MIKLGVIFGGKSGEHEISLMSAASVIRALDKNKYEVIKIGLTRQGQWLFYDGDVDKIENDTWENEAKPFNIGILKETIDFALPIMHGPYGEDGTIQGFFEILDIPYGGCNVVSSAAAMDKLIAKELFVKAGLPSCKYAKVIASAFKDEDAKKIGENVGFPCFIKPANMGSSVGISKAKDEAELIDAVKFAAKYDRRIIVEQGVNAREIESGVIGNEKPMVSEIGEIIPSAEFYDWTAKYFDGGKSKLIVPADLKEETVKKIKDLALKAYTALDCCGFARVDFFVDKDTEEVYINEINTIPGFTKFSMFPLLWGAAGVPYPQLIERIVDFGYERYNAKNSR